MVCSRRSSLSHSAAHPPAHPTIHPAIFEHARPRPFRQLEERALLTRAVGNVSEILTIDVVKFTQFVRNHPWDKIFKYRLDSVGLAPMLSIFVVF